ncbi:MAG: cytidine deaminase [Chitinophagales bacterium]
MKKFELVCSVQECDPEELSEEHKKLIEAANEALDTAYAPYSNFQVGAAILLSNNIIIKGSNQENAAYPSGLCAERVAFFNAAVQFPGIAINAVAITSSLRREEPIAPCGACRQVMAEYELNQNSTIKIILAPTKGKVFILNNIKDMLPLYFSGDWLRK